MRDYINDIAERICRGQRCDNYEWVYGYYILRNKKSYIACINETDAINISDSTAILKVAPVINDTVGYISNYWDMNGKVLYDGDVLQTDTSEDSPFTKDIHAIVRVSVGEIFADGDEELEADDFMHCYVIGNVHDNPELWELFDTDEDESWGEEEEE